MSEYPTSSSTSRPIHAGSTTVGAPAPPTVVPAEHAPGMMASGSSTYPSYNPSSSATVGAAPSMYPTKNSSSRSDVSEAGSDADAQATAPPVLDRPVAPRPDATGTMLSVPTHQSVLTATGGPDVTRRCDPLPPSIPLFPTQSSNVLDPTSIAHPQNATYDGTANMEATSAAAHPFYLSKQTNAALSTLGELAPIVSEMKLGDNSGPQYDSGAQQRADMDPANRAALAGSSSGAAGATQLSSSDTARRGSSSSSSSSSRSSSPSQAGGEKKQKKKKNRFFNTTLVHETKVPSHPLPDPAKYGPAPVSHPAVLPAPPVDTSSKQVIQATGPSVVPVATVATPHDSFMVHLSHPGGEPLGMNICSEDLNFTGVYITEVDPYGIAAQSGKISRGLFIQAVNGKSTIELKHADIVREMNMPEVDLLLSLHPFEKRASVIAPAMGHVPVEGAAEHIEPQSFSGERNVIIEKDDSDHIGLCLQGVRGVCISSIDRNSPASKSTIQVDDKLIAINNTNVVNATIEEVVSLFRQSPRMLTLTVVTPITKRISAFGVFSGPNLSKGGALREDELVFAQQMDAACPSAATNMSSSSAGMSQSSGAAAAAPLPASSQPYSSSLSSTHPTAYPAASSLPAQSSTTTTSTTTTTQHPMRTYNL